VSTCSTPAPTRYCLHPRKHRRSTTPSSIGAAAAARLCRGTRSTSAPAISAGDLRFAASFSTRARAPHRLSPMAARDAKRLSLPPEPWVERIPQQTAVALAAVGSHGSTPAATGCRGASQSILSWLAPPLPLQLLQPSVVVDPPSADEHRVMARSTAVGGLLPAGSGVVCRCASPCSTGNANPLLDFARAYHRRPATGVCPTTPPPTTSSLLGSRSSSYPPAAPNSPSHSCSSERGGRG
jgi:hypothetical protein